MVKTGNKIFASPRWRAVGRVLLLVVLMVFAYRFYRFGQRLDGAAFAAALTRPGNWRFALAAALLMPINWLLEARKWQILLRPFLGWGFGRTLGATLAGVGLSAVTPNRIGEIGGRMAVADRAEWAGVVGSSLLGSVCQWVAFLALGWPALTYVAGERLAAGLGAPVGWLWVVGPGVILVGLLGGRRLGRAVWTRGASWLGHDPKPGLLALERVKLGLIMRAASYAGLRYGVYCTQLYLLLWFFGLELPLGTGLAGIAAIYLVQAGVPLPPGINLVTRTELGLLLWGNAPATAVATLAAFGALFALNVLVPAVPGYWFLGRKTIFVK